MNARDNNKKSITFYECLEYILQVMLATILVLIDNVRNIGFWGEWKNGFVPEGIGVFVFGTIILHYGLKACNKVWIYIYSLICIVLLFLSKRLFYYIPGLYYGESLFIILNIWWGVIAIVFLIKDKNIYDNFQKLIKSFDKQKMWGILLLGAWGAFYLLASVSRYHKDLPVYMLILFGIFYLVPFGKQEFSRVLERMGSGLTLGFWLLQVMAFGFRPYDNPQYRGFYYNRNVFDIMCLAIFIISLFKVYEAAKKDKKIWGILWLVNLALIFDILLFSIGRGAILFAFLGMTAFIIVNQLLKKGKRLKGILINFGIALLAIVICIPITYCLIRFLPTILKHPVFFADEYFQENKVEGGAAWDDESYVSFREFSEAFVGRVKHTVENNNNFLEVSGENLIMDPDADTKEYFLGEEYNSIEYRLGIYRTYLAGINLRGHAKCDHILWISPHEQMYHAHNVIIQMLYSYGLLAGVIFCVWLVIYLINSIIYSFDNKDKWYGLMPLVIFLFFVGYGMIDCVWEIGQISLAMFLIIQKALFLENSYKIRK